MDVKLPSNGNLRAWFVPLSGLVDPAHPKASEVAAGTDISDAISWQDWGFGFQASETSSDPAITEKAALDSRGAANYGGTISFYYPKVLGDNSNKYAVVQAALDQPRTSGYIITRVDGEEARSGAATSASPVVAPTAGDFVSVYKITTDAQADSVTGEDAFRWTQTFVGTGFAKAYTILEGATNGTLTFSPTTVTGTGAGVNVVNVFYKATGDPSTNGRNVTHGGVTYTTSDATKATVSSNGVVTRIAAGTATITATYKPGVTATLAVTVS